MHAKDLLLKFNDSLNQVLKSSLWLRPQHQEHQFGCTEAHLYPLLAGGKRVRPLLCLLSAAAFGGKQSIDRAMASALALEWVHTYSLVHDDLPCMDNDDLRRGKPTTHKVYGEAKALLVGDGLLTSAFQLLVEPEVLGAEFASQSAFEKLHAVSVLSKAAGPAGMVRGQWLDLSLEGAQNSKQVASLFADEKTLGLVLEYIHELKTGELLGAALEIGFMHGFGHDSDTDLMKKTSPHFAKLGRAMGLFFQIQDDILDASQSSFTLGKTAGKDLHAAKLTAVSLWGLEQSQQKVAGLENEIKETLDVLWQFAKTQSGFKGDKTNFSALGAFINALSQRQF